MAAAGFHTGQDDIEAAEGLESSGEVGVER
jgi:hypothetical protein